MNRTVREEIRAENLHFANEINSRSLEQYHQMLNAFNTQATLIVGFALSAINHDNLNALASDQSRYCVYAQRKPAWAYVFGCSTVACISISLTCIAASFYLMWRSQMYALHVGVRAAVAMVRIWLKSIVVIYLFGMLFFFLAALATIWVYFGGENWVTVDTQWCPAGVSQCDQSDWAQVVTTDAGVTRTNCLNPHYEASHALQKRVSTTFAWSATAAFVLTMFLGAIFLYLIKRDFDRVEQAFHKEAPAPMPGMQANQGLPGQGRISGSSPSRSAHSDLESEVSEAPGVSPGLRGFGVGRAARGSITALRASVVRFAGAP